MYLTISDLENQNQKCWSGCNQQQGKCGYCGVEGRLPFQPIFEMTVVITLGFKNPNWPILIFFMKTNFGKI